MMKLKVVNDYQKHVVVEADTIGNLKSRIMDYFSIKAEDLMIERVLVPDGDGRDMRSFNIRLLSNCFDLLELEDRSILEDLDGLRDGDTLLIGWKGPFILSWVTPHPRTISLTPDPKRDVLVDCYTTVGELKQKLETASGEPVTEDNLPEILFNAEDNKQLLCFGLYRYHKTIKVAQHILRIYRNRYNERRFSEYDAPSLVFFDKYGNKPAVRYLDEEEEIKYVKYLDTSDGRLKLLPDCLSYYSDIQLKMFPPMPDLDVLPPYMGPATPSSMCLSNPPYGSAYHYDYGSPYGPYHLSGPPLHYDGGAMLSLGGLYGVPHLMDIYGMPMPHGPMAPRTGSYLEESSQRKRKGCENDWICPTCGYNNYSFRNVCNMSKCKTRRPGSHALRECLSR